MVNFNVGRILAGAALLFPFCPRPCANAQTITRNQDGSGFRAINGPLAAELILSRGRFQGFRIVDRAANQEVDLPEAFSISLKDGTAEGSSSMQWREPTIAPTLTAAGGSPDGKQICSDATTPQIDADFKWCLVLRPNTDYLRFILTIRARAADLPISEIRLLEFDDPEARVAGTVPGSPIEDGRMFLGFENPRSSSRVRDGHVTAWISRVLPLRAGETVEYSAVAGAADAGQMRRAFLNYIEAERPRKYAPFLDYTSWYDIGYGNRYGEQAALDRIDAFGRELKEKRGVTVNSFLFDDGWDDPNSFWKFNNGLPHGFTPIRNEAAKYGSGVGVWLSPWGGYGEEKKERIAYGEAHGYEIIRDGYALSGPRYFRDFAQVSEQMIARYGVNQFKFDGTGNAERVFPGSQFDSDFAAAIHLIEMLREQKPGIFINLTTGTWASPFWLRTVDSIWRGGDDHDFAGVGTRRQQWITYRDEQTYQNIVQKGPLFPLNSLMLHGIIYAAKAEGLETDPSGDFEDEVHSYFATGTQLQEMYITPSLLTSADWDILAKYARWSRENAGILRDTHWVGGDPGKLEVYGWAAWSREGWIITLRNPSDHGQTYPLHLRDALELPAGQPANYTVRERFNETNAPGAQWPADHPVDVALRPFEVRTFESTRP
jgi:hypothetical protein